MCHKDHDKPKNTCGGVSIAISLKRLESLQNPVIEIINLPTNRVGALAVLRIDSQLETDKLEVWGHVTSLIRQMPPKEVMV